MNRMRFLYLPWMLFACSSLLCLAARAETGTFVDKDLMSDLRVVSYNVFFDRIFPPYSETSERFVRVVNALQPDILNLQEIYRHSAQEVATLMNQAVPLSGGATWYAFRHSDNVIVSKFPFVQTQGYFGGATAIVDLPDRQFARDLFILNEHLPCCNNERGRQIAADSIVRLLEDARTDGGTAYLDQIDLAPRTPMLVLGDLNIVRSGRPLETLLHGDVLNEDVYGPDSPPDWDGTSLADANPSHNGIGPEDWTWRDDSDVFDPGILDFILYTDSVLKTANKFVLNTTTMSSAELAATGLEVNDVVIDPARGFFDHLPVVVDFRLTVPEPSSFMLMLVVLLTLNAAVRRYQVRASNPTRDLA